MGYVTIFHEHMDLKMHAIVDAYKSQVWMNPKITHIQT